jgi:hypothetical protein
MATLHVQPRPTPAERADAELEVEVDDGFLVDVATIEDWAAPRQNWEFTLHEGHDFGRTNNVEGRLLYVEGEQTSSIRFRLDQLDVAEDVMGELMLRFEEHDGIAKIVHCLANGMDVELFHILTTT